MNIQALWGFLIAGVIVTVVGKYFKNRGEKEVKVINVTSPEEKDEQGRYSGVRREDQETTGRVGKIRERRIGGRASVGHGENSTRESRTTSNSFRTSDETSTYRREGKVETSFNADSGDEQELSEHSRTTSCLKQNDSDIPEVPELD